MTEDQIKHMVDRFLGWSLPQDFNPDGGIHFEGSAGVCPMPYGTHLLTATQAEAMVRYMVEGLPAPATTGEGEVAWWKILADNWRGRNGNTTTGDSVRNSCADELEKVAARQSPAANNELRHLRDIERAFIDVCQELNCAVDNEAALVAARQLHADNKVLTDEYAECCEAIGRQGTECITLAEQIGQLKTQVERLKGYARHKSECHYNLGHDCNCGVEELRKP